MVVKKVMKVKGERIGDQRNQSIKHLNSHTDTIFPTQTIQNCHFPEHLILQSNLIQLHALGALSFSNGLYPSQ